MAQTTLKPFKIYIMFLIFKIMLNGESLLKFKTVSVSIN